MELNSFWYAFFGFAAIVISDINVIAKNNDHLTSLYAVGAGLIGLGCFDLAIQSTPVLPGAVRIVTGVIGLAALYGIIYCLFIFGKRVAWGKAEREAQKWWERELVDTGVYALCRHPALWCMWVFLFCLTASTGFPYRYSVIYAVAAFLVVWYEDTNAFPKMMRGYANYKTKTPFLFPNSGSVARCKATGKKSAEQKKAGK